MKPVSEMSLGERAAALDELRLKLTYRQGVEQYDTLLEDAAQLYRQLSEATVQGGRLWRLVLAQDG